MPTNTYVALDKVTVGTATPAITFTNIPQGYTDLVLVLSGTKTGASGEGIALRVGNGSLDTGSNYSDTILWGNGSSAGSDRTTSATRSRITYYASWISTAISVDTIHFQNYSNTTTYKTILSRANTANQGVDATVSLWRSTSAINTISVYPFADNFAVGTTASLYGIAATSVGAKATGGDIYADSQYYYHVFDSTGTFTPLQSLSCDVLSVGGGGGGGWGNGGGGGGGEIDLFSTVSTTATNYTVTVGAGGAGGTGSGGVRGGNGTTSSFSLGGTTFVSSLGGGGGGSGDASAGNTAGGNGGSGGGGNFSDVGGSASGSNTFAGGNGANSHPKYSGGGGGGATAAGATATASVGGNGGQGYAISNISGLSAIFPTTQVWSSGGGGGTSDINGGGVNTRGVGGTGAGSGAVSNGGTSVFASTSATSFGSGGGGGGWNGGGNAAAGLGFQGVVIIRYAK